MNVNPFSYLMNKISQKVSKSGDRMTGELEFYNLGDSIHINRAGNATYSGWLKFSNANGLCGMYGAHNDKKPYFYDGNNFTQIALMSDIYLTSFQQNVSVTANTTSDTMLDFAGNSIDTSKILNVTVTWNNPSNDVPTLVVYYSNNGYIYRVQHKWNVAQTVQFKVNVLLKK